MQVRSKKVTLTGYSADGLRKESPDCSVEIPEGSGETNKSAMLSQNVSNFR